MGMNYEHEYNRVMSLLRNAKMEHGLCEPRERKACTACNAKDELEKLIADYKGARVTAAAPSLHKEGAGGAPTVVCNVCHALLEIADGEHVCGLTAAEAYSLGWRRGNNAATSPPLPLQRTLPDEQFKGAVVETDYPDRLRMLMIEHRYIRDGGYSGCRCAKIQFGGQSWDADWLLWLRHIDSLLAASPAGRAEQPEPKP